MSESASGEATSSSDADNKESFSCPTCDKEFDTQTGMKIHHPHVHGESIAFDEYECYTCGTTFERRESAMEKTEKPVCSMECRSKVLSEAHTGENNHKYKESRVECSECGAEIEVQPIKLKTQDNYYCDQSCYGSWLSEHNSAEDHPQYDPNKPDSRIYHTKRWRNLRAKTIKRDGGVCQVCGTDESLLVHHIIPIKSGGKKWDMGNLVTMCRSCHGSWEGLFLRPDTR